MDRELLPQPSAVWFGLINNTLWWSLLKSYGQVEQDHTALASTPGPQAWKFKKTQNRNVLMDIPNERFKIIHLQNEQNICLPGSQQVE